MTPSEALYGFMAWLSTRSETVILGNNQGFAAVSPLIVKFSTTNKFESASRLNFVRADGRCSLTKLTADEALYAFTTWLISRPDTLEIGAGHDCSIIATLIDKFCQINDLHSPCDDWDQKLKYPNDFKQELTNLINSHCRENESHTPDFILADYLLSCLATYESATKQRDAWHNIGKIA